MGAVERQVSVQRLGEVPYSQALLLQEHLRDKCLHHGEQYLLLLEHPLVITLGRSAKSDHLLASAEFLQARGVEVIATGRGGDITLHGPGQLVAYPIIDLRPDRCDVRTYLRDLEEVMIRAVQRFGVMAERKPGLTGIWVGDHKLGAIGVRISRWVTMHGFSLNRTLDLDAYRWIVPCGISDRGVCTLQTLTNGCPPDEIALQDAVVEAFAEVFNADIAPPDTSSSRCDPLIV